MSDNRGIFMKIKTSFIVPIFCLTALAGCAPATVTPDTGEIPNMEEQFDTVSDVYLAFYADDESFNDDFGGWNYGSDGYLHVMVTCEDTSSYEFLNEDEKRAVFETVEYSLNYLVELAESFTLTVGDVTLEGGSVSVHKNQYKCIC